MSTTNPYLSPVVDIQTKSVTLLKNIIDNNTTDEHTRFGDALNKYISQPVALAQEAEDLIVYVTGYRPKRTNIKVYAKMRSASDSENFDDKDWTELAFLDDTNKLYSNNEEDYKELKYGLPKRATPTGTATISGSVMTVSAVSGSGKFAVGQTIVGTGVTPGTTITSISSGSGGVGAYNLDQSMTVGSPTTILGTPSTPSSHVAYADTSASVTSNQQEPDNIVKYFDKAYGVHSGIKNFSIKMVLLSEDPVVIPNARDIRAIALQL
jgi:hypothetical protein